MLDIRYILSNVDTVRENISARNMSADVDKVVALAAERSQLQQDTDALRHERKELASRLQSMPPEEKGNLVSQGKEIRGKIDQLENRANEVNAEIQAELEKIPNMTHPAVPRGAGEEQNAEIERWGEPAKPDFDVKDHVEIGEALGLIDFETGAKVAGRGFYFLAREAALLEQALVLWATRKLSDRGYVPHITPDVARTEILTGIGFNPRGENTQVYNIADQDLCLIGTAEITLGGRQQDTILAESELPMKLCGVSHCFRTEAGAAGRASRGLYRVHQFTKVEMFAFSTPEQSDDLLEEMLSIEKEIFQELGLPYRVVDCCTGDLGAQAYRKYDMEAWMPGRGDGGSYGEVTSCSNCTDYQARRLKIRFRREGAKKPLLVHTLNGTGVAVSRTLLSILENYQQADGSVVMPEVLRPFLGFDVIGPR